MKIHLWLNGKEISDEISPDMPLLEYVRTKGCYSVKLAVRHLTVDFVPCG